MRYRLRPSLPALLDDLPFRPEHVLELRWHRFAARLTLALFLTLTALSPLAVSRLLWVFEVGPLHQIWLRSGDGLWQIWSFPTSRPSYQPLADSLLWLEYQGFELRPQLYHLVSLLLHSANIALVWLLCRRIGIPGAWLVAVIFGLHPTQVSSVGWIGGQPTLLAASLSLGGLLAYLRFACINPLEVGEDPAPSSRARFPDGSPLYYVIACVLTSLSLLASPGTWGVSITLVLIIWHCTKRFEWRDIRPTIPLLLVSLVAGVASVWHAEANSAHSLAAVSLIDRLLICARSVGVYVLDFFVPTDRSFIGSPWTAEDAGIGHYLLAALVIGAPVVLWAGRRRWGTGPFAGAASLLILLAPNSGLVGLGWMHHSPTADHLAYVARIPVCIGIAVAVTRIADSTPRVESRRLRRLVFGSILVVVLMALAWHQSTHYADAATLWRRVLSANPSLPLAYRGHASALAEAGQYEAAVQQLRVATVRFPNDVDVATDLAISLAQVGRLDESERQLRWALHLRPDNDRAARQLAAIRTGRNDAEALQYVESILRRNPNDATARGQLGSLYRRQNQPEAAIREFRRAIDLQPSLIAVRLELADVLFQVGRLPESAAELQQVVRIDPRNFDAYMKAGDMLGVLKDFARAERMFRSAARIRPTSPEAYNNLGVSLAAQGRMSEAVFSFGQAVQLNPSFAPAHRNLAWATAQREGVPKELPATSPVN